LDKTNIKKLIEFITKEPTENEHKRGHKYPFMSAEILNAEISKILDLFLIPDSELEMKAKILKNIDNELSFSDEFSENIHMKKTSEPKKSDNEDKNNEEFIDAVEESDENRENNNNEANDKNKNEAEIKEDNTEKNNNEAIKEEEPSEEKIMQNIISSTSAVTSSIAVSTSEEPNDKIELLEYLLEFIETEGELNHVLSGYFSKFFISLLNRNASSVIYI